MMSLLSRGCPFARDFSLIKGPPPPPTPQPPLSPYPCPPSVVFHDDFSIMAALLNSSIRAALYRDNVISTAASDFSVGLHAAFLQTAKDTALVFMLPFCKQQRTQRWSSCCLSANSKGHSVGLHAAFLQTAKDTALVFMLPFCKQQRTQRWSSCCLSANSKGQRVCLQPGMTDSTFASEGGMVRLWRHRHHPAERNNGLCIFNRLKLEVANCCFKDQLCLKMSACSLFRMNTGL